VAHRGALLPDAHLGYGLPIGGVLAVRGAVIPYAVGVDIACRMKLTVLDLPTRVLEKEPERLRKVLEKETRFGLGAAFRRRRRHPVLDEDWGVTGVTRGLKDKAWAQLGTSGSGNHFVEFGELECEGEALGLPAGRHLALLSHSGSRGPGNEVATHFSRLAARLRPELPRELRHLAWLELDSAEGRDYWAAMSLMGRFAAANHELIHRHIAWGLGAEVVLDMENHHNFAWREVHDGEELVVHRKGATPAGKGVLGIIPGSMATPAFIVRGRGAAAALDSASHGAGRLMSRRRARATLSWSEAKQRLAAAKVTLVSADLDEAPMVYKDIERVMAAQQELVEVLARFHPRLVKMAPPGPRAED
jgi:tRNA-splicing ligase RtcB